MNSPFQFKRGASFDFSGQVKDGAAAYSLANCSLSADLRTRNGFAFVQKLNVEIKDPESGLVRLWAPAKDTAKWKVMPHLIDLRLVDGADNVLISNTIEVDITDRVTQ